METRNLEQSVQTCSEMFSPEEEEALAEGHRICLQIQGMYDKPRNDVSSPITTLLPLATRCFDQHPMSFVFVGKTGSGKTTLINCLLGGTAPLPSKGGKPCTGVVSRILHDAKGEAYATIRWLSEREILEDMQAFFQHFGIDADFDELSEELVDFLRTLEPPAEADAVSFGENQAAFLDIATQYRLARKDGTVPETHFSLEDEAEIERLNQIVTESSESNATPETRRIDLINDVIYHLKLRAGETLMNRIEIFDSPGLFGGGILHRKRLEKTLAHASRVYFVVNPRRISDEETTLMNRARQAVDPESEFTSVDQIQIVVNAIDEKIGDQGVQAVKGLVQTLYADAMPEKSYHEMSAQTAIWAEARLDGKSIEDPDKYRGNATTLAPEAVSSDKEIDHEQVLEASGVPAFRQSLLEELPHIVQKRLNRGYEILESIRAHIQAEIKACQQEINLLEGNQTIEVSDLSANTAEKVLDRGLRKARRQNMDFRGSRLEAIPDLRQTLADRSTPKVLKKLETALDENVLNTWEDSHYDELDKVRAVRAESVSPTTFFSKVEMLCLPVLRLALVGLATEIAQDYSAALKKDELRSKLITSVSSELWPPDETADLPLSPSTMDRISNGLREELQTDAPGIVKSILARDEYRLVPADDTGKAQPAEPQSGFGHLRGSSANRPVETHAAKMGFGSAATNEPEQAPDTLTKSVQGLPLIPTKPDFKPFIDAVLAKYQSFVEECIKTLLQDYEWVMLTSEVKIDNQVSEMSRQLRNSEEVRQRIATQELTTDDREVQKQLASLKSRLHELQETETNLQALNAKE